MRIEFSDLSLKEYNRVSATDMTPVQTCDYLNKEFEVRRFYPTLQKLYPHKDLETVLIDALVREDPAAKKEHAQRRLRSWKSGAVTPRSRETIFLIAFALRLSEQQASYLLGFVSDYGIHYREGRDLAYSYCLRVGKTYRQAKELFASLPPVPLLTNCAAGEFEQLRTQTVMDLFSPVSTDEEFRRVYAAHLSDLGAFHLRAYDAFQTYYSVLRNPADSLGDSVEETARKCSAQKIMELLSLRMPVQKDLSRFSVLQRMIKSQWPNETTLLKIARRKKDVSRKLLLLLYLVTENITDEAYDEFDEEYLTPEQRLEENRYKIDLMLDQCGMNPLDPRNAYDWLVLYSLKASEDSFEDSMSQRMQELIEQLFPPPESESTQEGEGFPL